MAQQITHPDTEYTVVAEVTKAAGEPEFIPAAVERATRVLQFGFTLLPILAGLDKFFNWLVNWEQYLAPAIANWLPISAGAFMRLGGVTEIAAGVLVAANPRVGGKVVACWLWAIIANLLMVPGYYDIAVRDFGLSLGALALSRLSEYTRS